MKRLAGYTLVVLATLTVIYLIWEFRPVVGVFLLSLLMAATVRPPIVRLTRRGVPLPLAMLVTYLVGLGLIVTGLYFISPALLADIQALANDLAFSYETLHPRWLNGTTVQQAIAGQLPPPAQLYESMTGQQGGLLVRSLFGVTQNLLTAVGGLILILSLSIYWSIDQNHFERLWLSLLPPEQRARAREAWRAIEIGVGGYIRSEAVQSLLAAALLGVGFWALGLRYATLLAIGGGLAWFIPLVGPLLIAAPAFAVGLTGSLSQGVAAGLYTLAILLFLELMIEPRLFNRRRYSSLLIVSLIIPLADAVGIAGLIIAPPLGAALQILFSQLVEKRVTKTADSTDQLADLEKRLNDLRLITDLQMETPPEVKNLLDRLARLIEKAEALATDEEASEQPAGVPGA